jgi:murein peptide amidase A
VSSEEIDEYLSRGPARSSGTGSIAGVVATLAAVAGFGAAFGSNRSLAIAAAQVSRPARYVLGYSVDHRPIVAWLVASGPARRSVLVVGSTAGDERGGIAVTRLLASQPAIPGVRLWLLPDVNPDGAARGTRGNADGVDLNRNFPFRWRRLGRPGSRFYSGPRPSSEPESRAIEAFIRRRRPGLAIWLHQPYGLIDDSQGPRWAERQLARAIGLPLERLPDYPGSAIGWDDHLVPASAFDLELPGQLSRPTVRLVATAIRSLARRFAADRPAS